MSKGTLNFIIYIAQVPTHHHLGTIIKDDEIQKTKKPKWKAKLPINHP